MTGATSSVLDGARRDAGLSRADLWLRYFELGGMAMPHEVEAFLVGSVIPSAHDHEVLVHALNERFSELGRNHPVPHDELAGGEQPAPDRGSRSARRRRRWRRRPRREGWR